MGLLVVDSFLTESLIECSILRDVAEIWASLSTDDVDHAGEAGDEIEPVVWTDAGAFGTLSGVDR